jgi:hypothetical protein
MTPVEVKLSVGRKLFYSVIMMVIAACVIEAVACLFFWTTGRMRGEYAFHPALRALSVKSPTMGGGFFSFDPFLAYRYTPNTRRYGTLEVNAHGFIPNGNSFPDLMQKTPGVKRVFILGGSTVAGAGASSNETTIAAQLERFLNLQNRGKYEVVNAGVDGYFSCQELIYYIFDLKRYSPDIVLFYDGINDFEHPCYVGGYRNAYQKDHCKPNCHEY